jgi:hypothetical protein
MNESKESINRSDDSFRLPMLTQTVRQVFIKILPISHEKTFIPYKHLYFQGMFCHTSSKAWFYRPQQKYDISRHIPDPARNVADPFRSCRERAKMVSGWGQYPAGCSHTIHWDAKKL